MKTKNYAVLLGMVFLVITGCREKQSSDAEQYFNRGVHRIELGNFESAISDFDRAIEINPNKSKYYYNRSVARQFLGDYQGFTKDLNKSNELILNELDTNY